ncbi:hypothetical protein D3C85_1799480 [compost metagenome]
MNVMLGSIVLLTCLLVPEEAFAVKVSTTPDILGTTGKAKLNSAYSKYFDDDNDGNGG